MQAAITLVLISIVLKASLLAFVLGAVSWFLHQFLILPLLDPLRHLPGPSGSVLQNHFSEVMNPSQSPDTHERWIKSFGKTFRFHGFGRHDLRLMSFDFRVVTHVLSSPAFEKPWQTRRLLARLIGRGIFSMEGKEHKLQRKIIGPAFTSLSIRNMNPVFVRKAQELCERWDSILSDEFSSHTKVSNKLSEGVIDVAHWISRASFDVIGLAGFNYHFHALEDESEEIYLAYRRMFKISDKGLRMRGLLDLYIPQLRRVWPTKDTITIDQSLRLIDQAGRRLVAKKKEAMATEQKHSSDIKERDLLSILIKSNLSSDPSKRLSDVELLDQCSTFLLAGSDSVSVALSWCLHFLALHPSVQVRLRQELSSVLSSYSPSHDSINEDNSDCSVDSGFAEEYIRPIQSRSEGNNSLKAYSAAIESLPFLNNVVRETLRLCPPVHGTIRVATRDDRIPISHPVTLADGTRETQYIKIRKGSYVHIPIEGLNYCSDIWGDDARDFNPDRWSNLPRSARSPAFPGLGNVMTFGFGPHSCLGHKFTVAEMKMFLASILPRFEFSPAEGIQISKCNSILTRPYITDKWELGTQLPLHVKKLHVT